MMIDVGALNLRAYRVVCAVDTYERSWVAGIRWNCECQMAAGDAPGLVAQPVDGTDAVATLALTCHTTITTVPTVIGVTQSCSSGATANDGTYDGLATVTVCSPLPGTSPSLNAISLLYVSDASSGDCDHVLDSFAYLAVALPPTQQAVSLTSGPALLHYAHSALTAWCGAACDVYSWSLPSKFRVSTAVLSAVQSVTMSFVPSNAMPVLGTVSQPSIELTGAGYVVTDLDVFEATQSGDRFTSFIVTVTAQGRDLAANGLPVAVASFDAVPPVVTVNRDRVQVRAGLNAAGAADNYGGGTAEPGLTFAGLPADVNAVLADFSTQYGGFNPLAAVTAGATRTLTDVVLNISDDGFEGSSPLYAPPVKLRVGLSSAGVPRVHVRDGDAVRS